MNPSVQILCLNFEEDLNVLCVETESDAKGRFPKKKLIELSFKHFLVGKVQKYVVFYAFLDHF